MSTSSASPRSRQPDREGPSAYGLFITLMSLVSVAITTTLLIETVLREEHRAPMQVIWILIAVDFVFSLLFLVDWLRSLVVARSKLRYLLGEKPGRSVPYGLLELLGAIPEPFLLRYVRLFRLARTGWRFSDTRPRMLGRAIVASRAESAVYSTVLLAFFVILLGSVAMMWFESEDPTANIKTSSDALWWALVTITTVSCSW